MGIRKDLQSLSNLPKYMSDKDVVQAVLQLAHKYSGGDTVNMVVKLQQLENDKLKKERQIDMMAVQSGMHSTSSFLRRFDEGKPKKAKLFADLYFDDDWLTYSIEICKSYFKEGISAGASPSGVWFFDKFKEVIFRMNDSGAFDKGGKNYNWKNNCGHSDYINLVIEKNKK